MVSFLFVRFKTLKTGLQFSFWLVFSHVHMIIIFILIQSSPVLSSRSSEAASTKKDEFFLLLIMVRLASSKHKPNYETKTWENHKKYIFNRTHLSSFGIYPSC